MLTVSLGQTKTNLSESLDRVENAEDVVITRHGKPVARVLRSKQHKQPLRSLAQFHAEVSHWHEPGTALLCTARGETL
jgi:prevent-host-death family protein